MKNKFRVLKVLLLIVIYCFGIGVVNANSIHSQPRIAQAKEQLNNNSIFSTNLLCNNSESGTGLNNSNNFSSPSFKDSIKNCRTSAYLKEQAIESNFSQYTNFSINFLIRYRKANIIFPFHYFW